MRFHADLHIHSKYSRACSKDCDLEHLTWWARRKGITVVGTGDFTHPAWFAHLQDSLEPAEPGLFRLRGDLDRDISRRLPSRLGADPVRFQLSVEISTIYKRSERTRKVHHLVYMPDFEAAAEFNRRLGRIGNLASDGRPILGLDSRDLLEIALECGEGAYLVPAHVWTPWFAVFGSKSGFDALEDCYLDLADQIFALETGLSSDPAMNWRISALDRYRMVSNSDAHSPPMLGRETTLFDTELDYFAMRRALETGDGHAGSVEFFPEEGKYHVDGHRKCGVRMDPQETRDHGGTCPVCQKPLTVGVLSRVEELADRPEGFRLEGAADFLSLVPLPEIMGEILEVGPKSKKVQREIDKLTAALGPELAILEDVPTSELQPHSTPLAEAIARLRRGEVIRDPGYDGEYGVIRLFEPDELRRATSIAVPELFDGSPFRVDPVPQPPEPERTRGPNPAPPTATTPAAPAQPPSPGFTATTLAPGSAAGPRTSAPAQSDGSLLDGLDPEQRAAAATSDGPLLIIAGPGTGKTRTLTHRIAHLVAERGVAPQHCLAITFTRRAAEEMAERLGALIPDQAAALTIATFHSLGQRILREQHHKVGLDADFGIADPAQQLAIATEIAGAEGKAKRLLNDLSRGRRGGADPIEPGGSDLVVGAERYTKELRQRNLVDFDDLIVLPVTLLESEPELAAAYRERYRWICVDEYQDVDEYQYRLLRQLAPPDGQLTAIGDPDQAIYRFRGADVGFFLRFGKDFPTARTVQLSRNYRSSAPILQGALRVVSPTTLVPDRVLHPMGAHGTALVGIHQAPTEVAEASFVARTIDQLLGGTSFHSLDSGRVADTEGAGGLGFADIAVLYRTDRQTRAIEAAFGRSGLPYQKRSHNRLVDLPGAQRILAELAQTPVDDPTDGTVAMRLRHATRTILASLPTEGGDVAAIEVHTAVELLKPLAERCGDDLLRFRDELALGVEADTLDTRAHGISLLTLHASKGLEFPVVFIVGCEEGLLPLRWPGARSTASDEEEISEERRLLFVGMTRAQPLLYLSHAAQRMHHGAVQKASPSRFLDALDRTLCEQVGVRAPKRRPRDTQLCLM